jgi:catechol 2,3-dioxygenase-like lactoylglutathione lyase family enzyme
MNIRALSMVLTWTALAGWLEVPALAAESELSITGRIHFNINVSDFSRSRPFYTLLGFTDSVGGFPESNTIEVSQAVGFADVYRLKAELAYFGRLPEEPLDLTVPTGRFVDLIEWLEPKRLEEPYQHLNHLGMARFALTTTNLDADIAFLKARGIGFLSPAAAQRANGSRFIIFRDPDGTYIELVEDPGMRTSAGPGLHTTGIRHVNVNVSNFERSQAFYRTLGFTEASSLPATENTEVARAMGFDEPYTIKGALLTNPLDGSVIELVEWLNPSDESPPYSTPINHLGIHRMNWATADLEGDVAKLKAKGVTFLSEIAPCCTGDTSTFGIIVFADPDGIYNQLMGNLPLDSGSN